MSTPETSRRAVDPAMLSAIPDAVKAARWLCWPGPGRPASRSRISMSLGGIGSSEQHS